MLIPRSQEKTSSLDHAAGRIRVRQIHPASALLGLLLVVFTASSVFFALNLKREIIPDERHHAAVSELFAATWGTPPDTPETYKYNYLGYRPNSYYWINGRVINLITLVMPSASGWQVLIALRLLNVLYALPTVLLCYLIGLEILKSRWWSLLAVFFLVNTLMYVFLSGGVNYDNLVNLLCFAGVYFLARVLNGRAFFENSLAWMSCLMAGMQVKFTVLPLALIMGLVWLVYAIRNRRVITLRPASARNGTLLLAVFAVLAAANAVLWGGNLIRFGAVLPACQQVLTEAQCQENYLIALEDEMFLPVRLGFEDILRGGPGMMDPAEWFGDYWVKVMLTKIYGILGHLSYFPDTIISFYRVLYAGVFLAAVRYWRRPAFAVTGMAVVVGLYVLVLAWNNYNGELVSSFKHPATQGRYVFPVIGPLYVLMAYSIAQIPYRWLRAAFVGLAMALFVWGSPPAVSVQDIQTWYPGRNVTVEEELAVIDGSAVFSQTFVSRCGGTIDRVDVLLETGEQPAGGPLTLQMVEVETGQIITQRTRPVQGKPGFHWYRFDVTPLGGSENRFYRIRLKAPANPEGTGLTAWVNRGKVAGAAHLAVNGQRVDATLNYRYLCRIPIFKDWFN